MPAWIWMIFVVVVLVIVANYVQEGLIRMMFYLVALLIAVAIVVKMTGVL